MELLRTLAPAKINLYLRVLGLRPDGYHEIDSLLVPIGLADTIELELPDSGKGFVVHCPGRPHLDGPANLAWRALDGYRRLRGWPAAARLTIHKRIALAAGLGGGSADAGATLRLLARADPHPLAPELLWRLAAELGSDVPFFLQDEPCRARGRGEELEPWPGLPPFWLVLALAPFGLSSAEVYEKRKQLTSAGAGGRNSHLAGRAGGEWFGLALVNDLQPASELLQPAIGRVRLALREAGAEAALMTGSGPAVFGLCRTEDEARAVAASVEKQPGWSYLTVPGNAAGG